MDFARLASARCSENSASVLHRVCMRFSNTHGARSFGARFPSLVGKAFNGTFIRRSVAKIFANVKRKEEAFSGVWPSALGCSIVRLQPIHPSPVGKPICRFSNARKRATNARSLFANRVEAKFSGRKSMLARRIVVAVDSW